MGRLMRMMQQKGVTPEPPSKPIKKVKLDLPDKLHPYQKEGVELIVAANGTILLADEMGLGKTCQALIYLNISPEVRPTLVMCPASLKLNWAKECFMWMDDEKHNNVYILSGKTNNKTIESVTQKKGRLELTQIDKLPKTGIIIMNYDILANDYEKYIDPETQEKKKREIKFTGWVDEIPAKSFKILIADEAHKIKDKKSNRTKAFKKLAKPIKKFIPISGTPIMSKPMELHTALSMIDPDNFGDYWKFGMRYCNPNNKGFATTFNGSSNTEELHRKLQPIMIRRLKADVLPQLPPKIRSIVPINMTNRQEYRLAENDFIAYLNSFDTEAALRAKNAVSFAKIAKLKELALIGKIDDCIGWIEDFISNDEKLVVFCTHNLAIECLQKSFKAVSVVVNGSVTGAKRNEAVEAFQRDPQKLLFIGNIDAAGVGLTLTASSAVAFIELPWTPGAVEQAIDRCHRIGTTAECINVYFLLAQNTIDEDIAALIDEKLKIVKQILDGEDVSDEAMLTALIRRMKLR